MHENEISSEIIGGAIEIHRHFGPGLEKPIYQATLTHELRLRQLTIVQHLSVDLDYKGLHIPSGHSIDLLVNDKVIVMVQAREIPLPVWRAILLSNLKLTGKRLGLLINFTVPTLKDGITRIVNNLTDE
ncbi:MAG: GxxExxY protein [Candidatus Sumerlaeota bacterium]|nr:GxxExxY protein [Candidatus Sumerlaeota bacterium]